MKRRWPSSPGGRAVVAVVAFFVVLNVVAFAVTTVAPEPSGEDGSAYATQPRGAAAYAELLGRVGRPLGAARLGAQERDDEPDEVQHDEERHDAGDDPGGGRAR